jgi:hypothetical protein
VAVVNAVMSGGGLWDAGRAELLDARRHLGDRVQATTALAVAGLRGRYCSWAYQNRRCIAALRARHAF